MNRFRKLKVWQLSMEMVERVYALLSQFPAQERFGLTDQIRRAAVSIPSNIAEGAGRESSKEFCGFLNIASGSASELSTQLEIAFRVGYISESDFQALDQNIQHVQNMIWKLHAHLKKTSEGYSSVSEPNDFEEPNYFTSPRIL